MSIEITLTSILIHPLTFDAQNKIHPLTFFNFSMHHYSLSSPTNLFSRVDLFMCKS